MTREEMLKNKKVAQHRAEMEQLFKEEKVLKKAIHPVDLYRQKKLSGWGK